MRASRKGVLIALLVGVILFGYSQYAFASQIEIGLAKSDIIEESEERFVYKLELEFENSSFLFLTLGESQFDIYENGEKIGSGTLDNFLLPPLSTITVDGTFVTDEKLTDDKTNNLRIDGVLDYNLRIISIDIPFVYYPTSDQAREFIDQN